MNIGNLQTCSNCGNASSTIETCYYCGKSVCENCRTAKYDTDTDENYFDCNACILDRNKQNQED